jgi:hypothetical protein
MREETPRSDMHGASGDVDTEIRASVPAPARAGRGTRPVSRRHVRRRIGAAGPCLSSVDQALSDTKQCCAFTPWLAPLHLCEWVVYAKRPLAAPEAVLTHLSRYTHRVAIADSRLVALDECGVTFRWKDYRAKGE